MFSIPALKWTVTVLLAAGLIILVFWYAGNIQQGHRLAPPGSGHLLGTDQIGRDIFLRTLQGFRYSLTQTLMVLCVSLAMGSFLGTVSALTRDKPFDQAMVFIAEGVRGFPTIVLVLVFASMGLNATWVLILYFWMPIWRYFRTALASQLRQPYVLNARLMGFSRVKVVLRELLPNITPNSLPYLGAVLADILAVQAALEFLGFGPPLNQPSLGGMLLNAINLGFSASWTWLPSLTCIILFIWTIHLLSNYYRRKGDWTPLE